MMTSHHDCSADPRRTPRRGLLGAAALTVAGAAVAVATVGGAALAVTPLGDAGHRATTGPTSSAASSVQRSTAEESPEGLAGVLASVLEGDITGSRNWTPNDAGSYGGEVRLNGSVVHVVIRPTHGSECGERALNCSEVPGGGHMQIGEVFSAVAGADDATDSVVDHYVAFYIAGLEILVAASDELSESELKAIATNPAFREFAASQG